MDNVIIQQFNPKTKCWNTIKILDESNYSEDFIPLDKYGGPFRTIFPKKVLDISIKDVVEEKEMEWEEEVQEEEFAEGELFSENKW